MENERSNENLPQEKAESGRVFLPRRRILFFVLIAAAGLALDLITKNILFGKLGFPSGKVQWVIENLVGFQTSLNEGALWGLGAGQITLFVTASIAALVGVLYWLKIEGKQSWVVVISLALITSGILGNLWDRLALHGMTWPQEFDPELAGKPIYAVRDWILVLIGTYHWPNFNIADSCLVVGTILMVCHILFKREKEV